MSDIILANQDIVKVDRKIQTDIFNYNSSEFFINMKESDIPPKGHPDRADFIKREREKCRNGVTINGVYITGRLYYHLNYHKILIDTPSGDRIVSNPLLRDNEWIIFNEYEKCIKEKRGFLIGGSRQISKTEFQCSTSLYAINLVKNTEALLLFTNSQDKQTYTKKAQVALAYGETFMMRQPIDNNWKNSEIRFGYTKKDNTSEIFARLFMYNTDGDNASEVGAGKTVGYFSYDEIAKESMRSSYEAVLPALISPYGLRCSPILAFCVCEGTKVWTKKGELKNIEELQVSDGILGWDNNNNNVSKEDITYWQGYTEKECVRITTNSGKYLECSLDHPILTRTIPLHKKELGFKDAGKLKKGDYIASINIVDVFGEEKMLDPRLTGWLVGDGTYRTHVSKYTRKDGTETLTDSCGIKLINADKDIWDYVESKYKIKDTVKPTLTKDGRTLRKVSIHGFVPEMRKLGLAGQTKDNKRLPNNIHNYTKEDICEFLGGYYDSDGCVYINKTSFGKKHYQQCLIKVSSANIDILKETQLLLLKLGIHSKITYCKPNFNNPKTKRGHYNLNVYERESLLNFANNIYFYVQKKQSLLDEIKQLLLENPTKQEVLKIDNLNLEKITNIEFIGIKRVFNLTANTTNTYLANSFVTHNTGGNVEKSKDAENMFFNPESARLKSFTYEGKQTGFFMGGWYRQDFKEKIKFGDFLNQEGFKIPKDSELNKIDFYKTNFNLANKVLDEEIEVAKKSKDPTAYLKQRMYFPRTLKDMFAKNNTNSFNKEFIDQQLEYLKDVGYDKVEVFRDIKTGEVKHKFSFASVIEDWRKPNFLDTPVKIWDFPKHTEFGVHVIGLDGYREDETLSSDSLGYFTVLRRLHSDLEDPFRGKQVASWLGRKKNVKEMLQLLLDVAEWYNAQILYEHVDRSVLDFFEAKRKLHLLIDTVPLQKEISIKTKTKNNKGLRPTVGNKQFLLNSTLGWVNEELEDESLGYSRIMDEVLLNQLAEYDPDENLDCYIGFSHAVAAYNYFEKFGIPQVEDSNKKQITSNKKPVIYNAFGIPYNKNKKNAFGF